MSLSDIKRKLYSKEEDKNLSFHEASEFDARSEGVDSIKNGEIKQDQQWRDEEIDVEALKRKQRAVKIVMSSVGAIVALFVVVMIISNLFQEKKVVVNIEKISAVNSGEDVSIEIDYVNDNFVPLKNAVMRVNYPEIFQPGENINFKAESSTGGVFAIGNVPMKSKGKIILSGHVFSAQSTLMYVKGELVYSRTGSSSQFICDGQTAINVSASVINLEIASPQELSNGDSINYEINYINKSDQEFSNVKLKIDYPDGFVFSFASPDVSEGTNVWNIGNLASHQAGKIVISGKMNGQQDQIKNATVYIGTLNQDQFVAYNTQKTSTKIVLAPLTIVQSINDSDSVIVNAGQTLHFSFSYQNTGDTGLRDVIITDKLDSPIFDYASLKLKGGQFDDNTKTITWKAVDDNKLKFFEPGQSGRMSFDIRIKNIIPNDIANNKNITAANFIKMDSPDIPRLATSDKIISGNVLNMKLESKIILTRALLYQDSLIPNSGPIEPKTGEASTYTVHWKVSNTSNNLTGANVSATLPTGVEMTGKISPDDGRLTYNQRNNSILWDLGNIEAWSGIVNTPREVAFQVKIIPSQIQAGHDIVLVNNAIFSAKDSFTQRDLKSEAVQIQTSDAKN